MTHPSEETRRVVDLNTRPGFEIAEVSEAKEYVLNALYSFTDANFISLDEDVDFIKPSDEIVETLLGLGWRPTVLD